MELSQIRGAESKITALYEIKQSIAVEIYKLSIWCGFDPELFDCYSFAVPLRPLSWIPPPAISVRLEKKCKEMVSIVNKIKELENA